MNINGSVWKVLKKVQQSCINFIILILSSLKTDSGNEKREKGVGEGVEKKKSKEGVGKVCE